MLLSLSRYANCTAKSPRFTSVVFGLLALVAWFLSGPGIQAQEVLYLSPDVPTPLELSIFEPYLGSQVIVHRSDGPPFYELVLTAPRHAPIDGLHRLDEVDAWLLSFEDGGYAPDVWVQANDIVKQRGAFGSLFFDGSCVSPALPETTDIGALSLFPDDHGDLLIALDVATTVGGETYLPTDVLVYARSAPDPCGWQLVGPVARLGAPPLSISPHGARITGLDRRDAQILLVTFDVPVDLAPTAGPMTSLPDDVLSIDLVTGTWDRVADLSTRGDPGWPVSSQIHGLSCVANPGRIPAAGDAAPTPILLDRLPGGDVQISCPGSCSGGARAYGVYEGSIAALRGGDYDHVLRACDAVCPGSPVVSPADSDSYYLVVPNNEETEGSYGRARIAGALTERPTAGATGDRCLVPQTITACP